MKSRLARLLSKKQYEPEEFDFDVANLRSILNMEKNFSTTIRDFISNFKETPDVLILSNIEDKESARLMLKQALFIISQ